MKTILVPTDFSQNAAHSMKYALDLAATLKAKIILLHAFESPVIYSNIPLTTIQFDYGMLHQAAVKKMNAYYARIKNQLNGVRVELSVQQGLASARIIETAYDQKADLIIMGSTGSSAVERVLLGSNASRVIKNAPCLVIAVPLKAKSKPIKKIVYTTDMTDDSLLHVSALTRFAKILDAEILFLMVENIFRDSNFSVEEMDKKIRKNVKYKKMSCHLSADLSITEGISNFNKEHKADILAMYMHHRNLLHNLIHKSITKEVALHSTLPLLVIHQGDL